ncbi:Glutamate--tRNA ligase [Nymphon striatum]|nr:Glutamate--tRNA ligase [Nymphon striatum]
MTTGLNGRRSLICLSKFPMPSVQFFAISKRRCLWEHKSHANAEAELKITPKLFPDLIPAPAELLAKFGGRRPAKNAMITRVGPSPTGMMHIGTLYVGLINAMLANQSDGTMILRLEDTDKSREVEGASEFIIQSLDRYGIKIDEGPTLSGQERGSHGPYVQSCRRKIYQSFAKHLLLQGKAYPCFSTRDELESARKEQAKLGVRTGYYGSWATWRDANDQAISNAIRARLPWVLRFRSDGDHSKKTSFEDCIFGQREMAENDQDIVILKNDGMPTYHFAHVVDDYLMGTTHVVRGEEWLASVPTHLQLFEAFDWQPPKYAHVAPINKMDGTSRRKLSKRKDPESSVLFFEQEGYPEEAVLEYLLSLADSGWGGPIFDFDKLDHVSKEYLASLSAREVFERGLQWANRFDKEFGKTLAVDPHYTQNALSIERGTANARKDIRKWSDLRSEIGYFFESCFRPDAKAASNHLSFLSRDELSGFVTQFLASYDPSNERDDWFARLKFVALENGFAASPKDFRHNPNNFKGSISHAAMVLRVLLTGSPISPDLFSIMQVMGPERVCRRLSMGATK